MTLSDITVLVPSIGRDSLINTICSIPPECNIIIGWDSDKVDMPIFDRQNVKYILYAYRSPGKTKQALIREVETTWFMILDDDDEIIDGYLQLVCNEVTFSKAIDPSWISSHWTKEYPKKSLESKNKSSKWMNIFPDVFEKYYFDWSYGKSKSEKYTLNHVIPSSAVLMKTAAFRKSNLKFQFNFLDEVIPTTYFMATHVGLLHKDYGLKYTSQDNSVSHPITDPSLSTDYLKVIASMADVHLHDPNLTSTLWARVIVNAIEATRFNYQRRFK